MFNYWSLGCLSVASGLGIKAYSYHGKNLNNDEKLSIRRSADL